MKYLKKYVIFEGVSKDGVGYNEDLIETLKELSLEYLDDYCILNYYIMTLNGDKMFYGGQYSHGDDRFNCYNMDTPGNLKKIGPNSGHLKYLIVISDNPYGVKIPPYNEEKSKELVSRLRELYPKENIATK